MLAALIVVTTAYIKVPAPLGYTHVGDSMVYLAAVLLPEPYGFFAAAVGGSMADLLAGYPQWALPTAIIKTLNVLPFFLVRLTFKKTDIFNRIINIPNLIMLVPAALVTLGGYFVANALLYDVSAAIAELLPNLIQATASSIVFVVTGVGLDAIKFKSRILAIRFSRQPRN